MPGVFISYRRDDSSGFAGRLADDLSEVFGADLIFMDVTGIEPGVDFRKAIEQKVGDCAAVLVVIGRSWLSGRGEGGTARLQDGNDFVRLEVASALRREIPVIPVLVDGAAMPAARDLPADVEPLAWRNAVELRHARWDADLQVLVSALQKLLPRKPAASATAARVDVPAAPQSSTGTVMRERRPLIRPLAAVAALVAIVALLWLRPWRDPDDAASADRTSTPPVAAGRSDPNYPATLPLAADVTVGASRVQVLSATVEREDAEHLRLRFIVRMTNLGPNASNFWSDSFRLVVDEAAAAPVNVLNELVQGYSAKEGEVTFNVGRGVTRAALQVSGGEETTRIPVDLGKAVRGVPAPPARKKLPGPFPMTLASGMQVRVGDVTYRILSADIRRRNMERLELHLSVRATNQGRYPLNFWDDTFRLEVDGIPRAPTSGLNEVVEGTSAKEGEVVFVVDDTIETLALLVGHGKEKTRVPLDLKR